MGTDIFLFSRLRQKLTRWQEQQNMQNLEHKFDEKLDIRDNLQVLIFVRTDTISSATN